MKKFESLNNELFEDFQLTNLQASNVLGGENGDAPVHTSSSTGWKYGDTEGKRGHVTVDFGDIRDPQ